MANLKEVRERITSVKNTQQITKAMKMVSAAKLKKAQDAITAMRPYSEKLTDLMSNFSDIISSSSISYLSETRDVKNVLVVSICSNTLISTLDASINMGYTIPSGPFLFFATNSRPVLETLSSMVLDIEKIKSATKHLLNASEIDSIVITSALSPERLVCEAVQTGQPYLCDNALSSS